MTLDEYLEALYDACFEEYCIENNIVTLLDPLEYFEERTSERKQRVQQQRKDAKKLAKTPIEQRPLKMEQNRKFKIKYGFWMMIRLKKNENSKEL